MASRVLCLVTLCTVGDIEKVIIEKNYNTKSEICSKSSVETSIPVHLTRVQGIVLLYTVETWRETELFYSSN